MPNPSSTLERVIKIEGKVERLENDLNNLSNQISELRLHFDKKFEDLRVGIYSHISGVAEGWEVELKTLRVGKTAFLEKALWLLLGAAVTIVVNMITSGRH